MTLALELRLTHGYVGQWKRLDQWQFLGTIDEIASRELPLPETDEEDSCDPKRWEVFALVKIDHEAADFYNRWLALPVDEHKLKPDAFEKWVHAQISTALRDVYTNAGCDHEWDCCGCRSYYAREPEIIARGDRDLWRIEIHSSRNY